MSQPLPPAYGRSTIADVLGSAAAHLGLAGASDVLGLPAARRFVVVLVDGLGWWPLQAHLAQAPYLAELFGDAVKLTSGAPSTTATSLTCLGTASAPGEHGVVGYTFRGEGDVRMNALTWENGPADVESFQSRPTVFERLAAAGVPSRSVMLPRFESSGLTRAAFRGATLVPVGEQTPADARVDAIVAASEQAPLVYVYERRLDHAGHGKGVDSPAWRRALTGIDAFLEDLRAELPDDVALIVTGDHGMVDVPATPGNRVLADDDLHLLRDVDLLAGEARFRQLYTRRPERVAAVWQDVLGERAWVVTRDDAFERGWFGPVAAPVRDRIGDVLVAMRDRFAVMSLEFPQELTLVGMHGSLTPAETEVPLLIDHPASWNDEVTRG